MKSSAGPASTVIDGGNTSVVVVFKSAETRASILRGFTITHGLLPSVGGPGVLSGAGIAIADASPTIIGNVVTDNDGANHSGAGIGAIGAPLIKDNVIVGNHTAGTGAGGGILAGGGAEIIGNRIEDNVAGGGGGMVLYGGTTVVRDNIIRGNRAGDFDGGGVAFNGPGGFFVNNLVAGNIAGVQGGGVAWLNTDTFNIPVLLNNTIVGNQAPAGSAIARVVDGGAAASLILAGNVIVGDSTTGLLQCGGDDALQFMRNDVYNGTGSPYERLRRPHRHQRQHLRRPAVRVAHRLPPPARLSGHRRRRSHGDRRCRPPTWPASPASPTATATALAIVDMGAYEAPAMAIVGSRYHPLQPARILDTRLGVGAAGPIGPGATLNLQVTGQGGIPATGRVRGGPQRDRDRAHGAGLPHRLADRVAVPAGRQPQLRRRPDRAQPRDRQGGRREAR